VLGELDLAVHAVIVAYEASDEADYHDRGRR
jgi:hypothetical protein